MNDILDLLGKAGIPAIVITIIGLIAKVRPISFVTSNHFERKMSSKEWRFSYGAIMYLAQSIFYSVIIMALSEFCYKWKWLNSKLLSYIFFAITVLIILGFLYFYYKQEKRIRYIPSKSLAKNLGTAGFTSLYFLGWIAMTIFYIGRVAFLTISHDGKDSIPPMGQLAVFIIIFIFSSFLPLILKSLSNYLAVNPEKGFTILLENETWFLLYPISKDEFLLGDASNYSESKRLKIIKRENLIQSTFKVVDREVSESH